MERAMMGSPTVMMPLVKLAMKPTKEGVKIVRKVWRVDTLFRDGAVEDSASDKR
jgi:hypothetical protein